MPPKKKKIDYKMLNKYCEIQCTGEECAGLLDIDYDTLNNRLKEDGKGGFSEYFKRKSAKGKASLRRKQYQIASGGNPTMLIWLGKQWLGQNDLRRPDEDAGQAVNGFVPTYVSDEVYKELQSAIENNKKIPDEMAGKTLLDNDDMDA